MTGHSDPAQDPAPEASGREEGLRALADPRRLALAAARCLRFHSRLPVPRLPGEADPHAVPDFRIEPVGLPLAALAIVAPAALAMLAASWLRLDPLLVAALALTALVITTGAFHEDGLGDTADGLFGGGDAARRLEIMKDSRMGMFAGCAIALSLLLRVAALAAILRSGGPDAALGALAIAAMVSRVEGVRILATLPPARAGGASAAVGRPGLPTLACAAALALALALGIVAISGLPLLGTLGGIVAGSALVGVLGAMARRLIGGQTGDIAGAAQQLAEIGIYVGIAAALAP